jgi:hypothetical protein
LRWKLAAEKAFGCGGGVPEVREGVCCLPNVDPLRHVDLSLDLGDCSLMSNVNVAVNSDVISDATSIGTRDTSANIPPSGSSADRTTLKPGQWARKQLPRPTDSGPPHDPHAVEGN